MLQNQLHSILQLKALSQVLHLFKQRHNTITLHGDPCLFQRQECEQSWIWIVVKEWCIFNVLIRQHFDQTQIDQNNVGVSDWEHAFRPDCVKRSKCQRTYFLTFELRRFRDICSISLWQHWIRSTANYPTSLLRQAAKIYASTDLIVCGCLLTD